MENNEEEIIIDEGVKSTVNTTRSNIRHNGLEVAVEAEEGRAVVNVDAVETEEETVE